MEYIELNDLLSKNERIKKFFDAAKDTYGNEYEEFENKYYAKEFGKSLELDTDTEFWLAGMHKRFLHAYSWERHIFLGKVIENGELKKALDKTFPEKSEEILDFIKGWMTAARFNLLRRNRTDLAKSSEKKKQTWKSGDLFLFPTETEQNHFGRILVSLKNCFKGKKKNARRNRLAGFSNYFLVELYGEVSDNRYPIEMKPIALPMILTDGAFSDGYCENIGNLPVTIQDIDFPESLTMELDDEGNDRGYFVKGELMLPIDELKVKAWPQLFNDDLSRTSYAIDFYVEDFDKWANHEFDIRLQPSSVRNRIYELIGEDPNATYFTLTQKYGIDTSNYLK